MKNQKSLDTTNNYLFEIWLSHCKYLGFLLFLFTFGHAVLFSYQDSMGADSLYKITFDISKLDEYGLYGPPGGKRALSYEFCIAGGFFRGQGGLCIVNSKFLCGPDMDVIIFLDICGEISGTFLKVPAHSR